MSQTPDPYLSHWADHAATRTLKAHPDATKVTVAAGITPSGVVHVGNFREVITVDLVARALRDRGVEVRFLYSWDDFDVFRKVPANMPAQDVLSQNLGRSIVDVPDPFGDHQSYADHNIAAFESSLAPLRIEPEFIRQHARYRSGAYAESIRAALEHRADIRAILNRAREQHGARSLLPETWLPLAGFCDSCGRDELEFSWDGEWTVHVGCKTAGCGHEGDVDLRSGGNIKLPWRIDWPMRWAHERVCFEPGGKDHSSAGGSYDTAQHIVRDVYGWRAPEYVGYDFVSIKGRGGKISSSKGDVVTVADCLEIYEPTVLRWLFAGYRPNTEFQISFDLDVLKIYEDFDRTVRLAHEPDDGGRKDKKRQVARRTLQLASLDHVRITPGSPAPSVVPFRQLSVILQIFDGDIAGAQRHFEAEGVLEGDEDRQRFVERATCVWKWIEHHAPEDFRYRIRREPVQKPIDGEIMNALTQLIDLLAGSSEIDDATVAKFMKNLGQDTGLELKRFYPVVYDLLIARDHGPKLSTLISTMGPARALPLLRPSAGGE